MTRKLSRYIKDENGHFLCPHCGVTKENQNTMYYHMQRHEGRLPHECGICKKGFIQKTELQLHTLKYHPVDEAPAKTACPIDGCDFADYRKGNVRTHLMRKHAAPLLEEIISRTAAGNWHCACCEATIGSAAGFYYHLYGCAAGVLPADSEIGQAIAALG